MITPTVAAIANSQNTGMTLARDKSNDVLLHSLAFGANLLITGMRMSNQTVGMV